MLFVNTAKDRRQSLKFDFHSKSEYYCIKIEYTPVDTGRKLNVHKTFKGRPLNVLCTFNLPPVSTGTLVSFKLSTTFFQQLFISFCV